MLTKTINSLKNNLLSIPGWKTNRKIIVIESDDWGTERSPTKNIIDHISNIYNIELNPYIKYDSLENEDDLTALFESLKSIKNKEGRNPIFTANCIVANPNFDKIKSSNYTEYHYELVTDTFSKYSNRQKCFNIWNNGMTENLFKPQFHGREHINVSLWLNQLQSGDKLIHALFENRFWGIVKKGESNFVTKNSMAGCNYSSTAELAFIKNSLLEGLAIFESIIGYKSKSFIANNYIWDENIEKILLEKAVFYIQGQSFQLYPEFTRKITTKNGKRHFTGQTNKSKQIYLTRNCFFEPCTDNYFSENLALCLDQIEKAFRWKNPAIISTHRVNFIGSIDEKNRTENLEKLKLLLSTVVKKYPDVEFMTSDQLGELIKNTNK